MGQAIQRDVRSAITMAYGLMRHAHVLHREWMSHVLGELEDSLRRIEADLGGPRRDTLQLAELGPALDEVESLIGDADPVLGKQLEALVTSVRRIERRLTFGASRRIPSRPLLGVLPIARVVPQDVHTIVDWTSSGAVGAAGLFACSARAKVTSAALAASGVAVSATTDYRLSAAKLIPIEAHEVIDYVWGATAIAAPFVLGYYRKDPITAITHVVTGAAVIVASLFTDYRAATGVGRR